MKRCFRCNQVVDNFVNTCPGCGNNYFLPEKTNSIDSNMVMQQVSSQTTNTEEAGFGYYILGFILGLVLPIIVFAIILLLTKGEVRRKLRNGALAGILITFVLTILIVAGIH